MKTTEISQKHFSLIDGNEITHLGGGEGFAHDFGTALRYFGIYVANGGGVAGNFEAMVDLATNYYINNY